MIDNEQSYLKSLEFVLEAECGRNKDGSFKTGYVNHPADPGGETKYGITFKTLERAKKAGLVPSEVTVKTLTLDQAKRIYYEFYWVEGNCQQLDWPMNLCVFDTAVNMGFGGVGKILRKMTGDTWSEFLQCRIVRYKELNNPTFEKGWINRVNNLKKYITIVEEELQSE